MERDIEQRDKILQATLKRIDKECGKGAVIMLGDSPISPVPTIPTGSLSLDVALGVGGMPRGRIVEAYGPPGCGKTTLGLHMISEAQRTGGLVAYVDLEHSLDLAYANAIGVDVPTVLLSQPSSGNEGLKVVDELTLSGTIDIIIVDSVSALVPEEELASPIDKQLPGLQAAMMSRALRRLASRAAVSGTIIYFINQLRMKIGVMFGSPETTSGGEALKYYSTIRLDVRRREAIKDGDVILGATTEVKVVKNKVAPPFRKCKFDIMYGTGIDITRDILDLGVECGIIKLNGAWYSYDDERMGQGKENAKAWLKEQVDIANHIRDMILIQKLPHRYGVVDVEPEQGGENGGADEES
ncbi:MAG: recombinase RecA [Nitrosomonadaceae bacterium]|nr:recombinase RecA [Nitrosomonadaceae bacterium]